VSRASTPDPAVKKNLRSFAEDLSVGAEVAAGDLLDAK